jgi:hypothetical protein
MDSFLDAPVCELQDHVEIIFVLTDVDQELVHILLMIYQLVLGLHQQFLLQGLVLIQTLQAFYLLENLLLFLIKFCYPCVSRGRVVHFLPFPVVHPYLACFESLLLLLSVQGVRSDLSPLGYDILGLVLIFHLINEVSSCRDHRNAQDLNCVSRLSFREVSSTIILHVLNFEVLVSDYKDRSVIEDPLLYD